MKEDRFSRSAGLVPATSPDLPAPSREGNRVLDIVRVSGRVRHASKIAREDTQIAAANAYRDVRLLQIGYATRAALGAIAIEGSRQSDALMVGALGQVGDVHNTISEQTDDTRLAVVETCDRSRTKLMAKLEAGGLSDDMAQQLHALSVRDRDANIERATRRADLMRDIVEGSYASMLRSMRSRSE